MKNPRKITHSIPENKIEYCDEIGADSETDTENSFPTEVCNFKHIEEILLQKLPRKSFLCDHCNQNFKHNWSLNLHERIHTGIKPSTCQFCNKYFSYAEDATVHERIHPGEKPFLCKIINL